MKSKKNLPTKMYIATCEWKSINATEKSKEIITPAMNRINLLLELAKKTPHTLYAGLIYWSDRDLARLLAYYNL